MATCLKCKKYRHKRSDRYCGLCGAPLCSLGLENGGQVDVPLAAEGRVEVSLLAENKGLVENKGLADLHLQLREPSEPGVVRVLGPKDEILLRPLDEPTKIWLEVDADGLRARPGLVVTVPFASDDPAKPHGHLHICFPSPGEIHITPTELDLGRILSGVQRHEHTKKTRFSVRAQNTGGARVQVMIGPRPTDSEITVSFADGREAWVDGYGTADLSFVAWSEGDRSPGPIRDAFELVFEGVSDGARKQEAIWLTAERFVPPEPDCTGVDFGVVVPSENRVAFLTVRNRGSVAFSVESIELSSDCVRVLTRVPVRVQPGEDGAAIELFFSTRFLDETWPSATTRELSGYVLLRTDIPEQPAIPVEWRVEVRSPRIDELGVLAVDFGTVNSCVAYDGGQGAPEPVPIGEEGEAVVPSLLAFLGPELFVIGKKAEDEARIHPGNVVHSIKRCLVEGEREFFGRKYTPVELASFIIEQLLLKATRVQGVRPKRIQMTVPASFWGPRREAMLEACRRAWPDREQIKVMDEPTACALYYVFKHPREFRDPSRTERILVFDFGGGTLDISIVQLRPAGAWHRDVQPVITRGNGLLGGIDLDLSTLRAVADKACSCVPSFAASTIKESRLAFEKRYFGRRDTRLVFQAARFMWMEEARSAKETLSDEPGVTFAVEELHGDHGRILTNASGPIEFHYDLGQKEFEDDIIGRSVRAAQRLVRSTLTACGLGPDDIDVVLLAGQTCNNPKIRRVIGGMFPKARVPGVSSFDLKESVACGAALAAYYLSTPETPWQPKKLACTSYRYGIRQLDAAGTRWVFREIVPLFARFDASPPPIRVRVSASTLIEVGQYAGNDEGLGGDGDDELWTRLGVLRVAAEGLDRGRTVQLALRFSERDESLIAEIDGQQVDLIPTGEDALERAYL